MNKINVRYTQLRDFTHMDHIRTKQYCGELLEKDLLCAEGLKVEAPRRCKRCRGCSECSFRGRKFLIRKQQNGS